MQFSLVLIIGVGGFLGTIARYLGVQLIDNKLNSSFPWGTLLVNLTGCFLIGLIYGLNSKNELLAKNWRLFLTTGFCGGYTTFSAFALENILMIHQKAIPSAVIYIFASVIVGLLATLAGALAGRALS
jgi:fluoride exporter